MTSTSPSFRDHMHVIKTKALSRFYTTEEELRRDFINAVEFFLIENNVTPVIEMERKIIRGRPDARIGAVVFELENPIDNRGRIKNLLSDSKIEQLRGYISEMRIAEGQPVVGVATNGIEVVLVDEHGEIRDRGDLFEKSWALEVWLTTLTLYIWEPRDLLERLGPQSSIGRDLIISLWQSFIDYKDKLPFVRESFDAWNGLYGCAVNLTEDVQREIQRYTSTNFDLSLDNINDVEEFIFVMETYLSMLMKSLVARTLLQKLLVPQTSVGMLLEPDYVEGFFRLDDRVPLAKNVFEANVFTWFVDIAREDRNFAKSFEAKIRIMINQLDAIDLSDVPIDLLRRMYQEFFDPALRKALGEFYTSEDMVDEILDVAGFIGTEVEQWARSALESDDRYILDPCCGSGTFLIRVINRVKKTSLTIEEKLRVIINKVVGIDIHPFAVAMARCNYIISISDLVRSARRLRVMDIPIFWADSLAMLTKSIKMEPRVESAIATIYEASLPVLGHFTLPDPNVIELGELLTIVRRAVDEGWSEEAYIDELKGIFGEDAFLIYKEQVIDLYQIFKSRKDQGLNGRWVTFLKNVFIVEEIKDKCELVCSNPPWVRIHNIVNTIRDNLINNYAFYKKKVVGWKPNFKKTRTPFRAQFDYSMGFVESGLRYLRQGGHLAFVITAKIQQALYANILRSTLLDYKIVKLKDYSHYPISLFQDAVSYPLILVACKEDFEDPHEFLFDVLNTRGQCQSWRVRQSEFTLLRRDQESPWLIAPPEVINVIRKMQNNVRLGDIIEVNMGVKVARKGLFIIKEFTPTAAEGMIVAITEGGHKVRLEKDVLRLFVRGRDIEPWIFSASDYVIWTHNDENGKVLDNIPSNVNDYFEDHREELISRTDYREGQPIWVIFRVSERKLMDKIAWKLIGKKLEAVMLPRVFDDTQIGEKILIVDNSVYFISVKNEDIGYAISGLLNSTPIRTFIMSFADRHRGGYFEHPAWVISSIPVPRPISSMITLNSQSSNEEKEIFQQLVDLPKKIHEEAKKGCISTDSLEELDRVVARSYDLSENEFEILQKYFNFISSALNIPEKEPYYRKGSIYDPILDQFLECSDDLVEVHIEDKDVNYLRTQLNKRIEARGLKDKMEISVINGVLYLEKT